MMQTEIAKLVKKGWTYRKIGERFGMTKTGVSSYCRRHGIKQVGINGGGHARLATVEAEAEWLGMFGDRRFEDHPRARRDGGKVSRPATIVMSQSSAA